MNEYTELIYSGQKFSIEAWKPSPERCLVIEWLEKIPQKEQAKFAALFVRLGDQGRIFNEHKFKHLTKTKLYEFKVCQKRILSFFCVNGRVILTHGFSKKSQKTPQNEILRAELIRNTILERIIDEQKKLDK